MTITEAPYSCRRCLFVEPIHSVLTPETLTVFQFTRANMTPSSFLPKASINSILLGSADIVSTADDPANVVPDMKTKTPGR